MTPSENRQRIKNEALNKIRRIVKGPYRGDEFDSSSTSEQKMFEVESIIENMEREIHEVNSKEHEQKRLEEEKRLAAKNNESAA